MTKLLRARAFGTSLLALVAAAPAFAQTTVLDEAPIPFQNGGHGELLVQKLTVPGGTLYCPTMRDQNEAGPVIAAGACAFVPAASGGLTRYLALTNAKSDLAVPMTAAAGTPSGTVGIARTAGTSMNLVGEATSSSAKTDKALFEFNLPDSYVAGANVAVTVNCGATGGTITAGSTTMTVAANTELNGAEAALTVSAAQQIPASPGNLTFTITGTSLIPGAHLTLELTMLVTTSAGAGTGTIYSVGYGA